MFCKIRPSESIIRLSKGVLRPFESVLRPSEMVLNYSVVDIYLIHSNFRQVKKLVQMYSNCDEFPVSLISAIRL